MSQEYVMKTLKSVPLVKEEPVVIMGNDTNYKAIVDTDTKETLSIVTNDYQLLQHREVYETIQNMGKYTFRDATLFNQGKALMIELEPQKRTKVELLPGDYLEPRVRIFNSYDKSRALSVQSFGLRLVCSNGMMAPGFFDIYHKSHMHQNIDIEILGKQIDIAMVAWNNRAEILKKATGVEVEVAVVVDGIRHFSDKYKKIVVENLDEKATVYDLWNELTRTITHDIAPNIGTDRLVYLQKAANTVFKHVEDEN